MSAPPPAPGTPSRRRSGTPRLFVVAGLVCAAVFAVKLPPLAGTLAGLGSTARAADAAAPAPEAHDAAADTTAEAHDAAADTTAEAHEAADAPATTAPAPQSAAEADLLLSLGARREQLDARERAIADREALLAAAEKRIDGRIAELKALEERINATLRLRDEEAEKQLAGLVKVYETMKPAEAARILEKLDPVTRLDVVQRMKTAKLAPVMAQLDPAVAKDVTVALADLAKPVTPPVTAPAAEAAPVPASEPVTPPAAEATGAAAGAAPDAEAPAAEGPGDTPAPAQGGE